MENYLSTITNYLLTQSWQIAALVAIIAALSLALKNRSAHIRYLLWLIVLAKCLVPPLLTVPLAVLPQDKPVPVFEIAAMPKVEPLPLPSTPVPPSPTRTVAARPARLSPRQWLGLDRWGSDICPCRHDQSVANPVLAQGETKTASS